MPRVPFEAPGVMDGLMARCSSHLQILLFGFFLLSLACSAPMPDSPGPAAAIGAEAQASGAIEKQSRPDRELVAATAAARTVDGDEPETLHPSAGADSLGRPRFEPARLAAPQPMRADNRQLPF